MKFNKIVLIAVIAFGTATGAHAADAKADQKAAEKKVRTIEELFKLQKTDQVGNQVIIQISDMLAQQYPEGKRKDVDAAVKKEANIKELSEALVPVYVRNFSQSEIDDVIAFYKTPTGQKFLTIQPKMIAESTEVIQKWAGTVSSKVKAKLDKKK